MMQRNHVTGTMLILAALFPVIVQAQAPLPRRPAEMTRTLGLRRGQVRRIATIDRRYGPRYAAVAQRYLPEVAALRKQLASIESRYVAEMRALVAQRGKEVDAVLTAGQRARASELDKAFRARYARERAAALSSVRRP
jgi:hypothetical protein